MKAAARLWNSAPLRWTALLLSIALSSAIVWRAAYHPVDFGQYPAEVHLVLGGQRELYGPQSGLGWPMVYRCSPVFLLLFFPLALLPLHFAAGVWAILKFVGLFLVIRMVDRMAKRTSQTDETPGAWWLYVLLVCASYVVQEIRGGNVQFFIFALTVAGFFFLESHPALSGASFALGASIKLLPIFFIPYLWVRGYRQATYMFAIFFAGLMLLPSLYFGFHWNLHLLKSWWTVGLAGSTSQWANNPDHSLLGVMNRYFSVIPYSTHFDPNYRNINFANFSPIALRRIWQVVAAGAYLALLWLGFELHRREKSGDRRIQMREMDVLTFAILFCAQLLLAPVTERIYLVALLFPAIVLARELGDLPVSYPGRNVIFLMATLAVMLFALPPLVPGRTNQRLLAVYSPDFWGMLSLVACLILLLRTQLRLRSSETPVLEGSLVRPSHLRNC